MHVEKRGLEPFDQAAPHVEEAGAARAAEELAPGAGEDVTPDLAHVDRQLADRLARVEQKRDARRPGDAPHGRGGVDEPALGRHVHERDELDAVVEQPLERLDVDLAGLVVRDDLDGCARAGGDLAERDPVRRVLGAPGEDPVAGGEAERVERHVPRPRRVLDDRDLVAVGTDQRSDRVVAVLQAVGPFRRRLVAADLGLAAEMVDDARRRRRSAEARSPRC